MELAAKHSCCRLSAVRRLPLLAVAGRAGAAAACRLCSSCCSRSTASSTSCPTVLLPDRVRDWPRLLEDGSVVERVGRGRTEPRSWLGCRGGIGLCASAWTDAATAVVAADSKGEESVAAARAHGALPSLPACFPAPPAPSSSGSGATQQVSARRPRSAGIVGAGQGSAHPPGLSPAARRPQHALPRGGSARGRGLRSRSELICVRPSPPACRVLHPAPAAWAHAAAPRTPCAHCSTLWQQVLLWLRWRACKRARLHPWPRTPCHHTVWCTPW